MSDPGSERAVHRRNGPCRNGRPLWQRRVHRRFSRHHHGAEQPPGNGQHRGPRRPDDLRSASWLSRPESRLPGKTREAWATELTKQRTISSLEPAIVTQVDKNGLQVLTRTGKEHVSWDTMKWARPFLNTNSMGPNPKQPSDVAQVGDLIRVSVSQTTR